MIVPVGAFATVACTSTATTTTARRWKANFSPRGLGPGSHVDGCKRVTKGPMIILSLKKSNTQTSRVERLSVYQTVRKKTPTEGQWRLSTLNGSTESNVVKPRGAGDFFFVISPFPSCSPVVNVARNQLDWISGRGRINKRLPVVAIFALFGVGGTVAIFIVIVIIISLYSDRLFFNLVRLNRLFLFLPFHHEDAAPNALSGHHSISIRMT